jgi:hypothetical protein
VAGTCFGDAPIAAELVRTHIGFGYGERSASALGIWKWGFLTQYLSDQLGMNGISVKTSARLSGSISVQYVAEHATDTPLMYPGYILEIGLTKFFNLVRGRRQSGGTDEASRYCLTGFKNFRRISVFNDLIRCLR